LAGRSYRSVENCYRLISATVPATTGFTGTVTVCIRGLIRFSGVHSGSSAVLANAAADDYGRPVPGSVKL
jgi:hypothetical protein